MSEASETLLAMLLVLVFLAAVFTIPVLIAWLAKKLGVL